MKRNYFLIIAAALILLLFPKTEALAANPQKASLALNRTYTQYDITGDGQADTIRISSISRQYSMYKGLKVSVNGSTCYKVSSSYDYYYQLDAKLYTLSNQKVFLYLYAIGDNTDGPVCALFYYKDGTLVKNVNFQTLLKKYGIHNSGAVKSVSGNKMTLVFYNMSWTTGSAEYEMPYTYKSGKMTAASKYGKFTTGREKYWGQKNWTVKKSSLAAYKKPGSKTKAMTLKKGNRIQFGKCYISGGKLYLQVKKGSRTGWINPLTKAAKYNYKTNSYDGYFRETQYAG